MPLVTGTSLGSYEIVGPLGAGGMGEVYRARDTRLKRDVAIKVLPEAFAHDADRLARFQREAELLAALNHPNIAGVHGLESAGGVTAIVLELVDGETLAERISHRLLPSAMSHQPSRGLPLDDALAIARQIAAALEAAHERGIVHRDLKPANIKVTPDGIAKVLDFGLAKAMEHGQGDGSPGAAGGDPSPFTHSPTLSRMATAAGMILGTAPYMAPEQAKGRAADKRSDVWAFGCVLYEMLAGRRAFEGEDVSDTLATVLKGEPDWGALPSTVPPAIRALVHGCLRKDRKERIGDISTALFLLNQREAIDAPGRVLKTPQQSASQRALFVVAGILIGAAAAALMLWQLRPAPPRAAVTRFAFTLPQGQQLTLPRQAVAISPNGERMAYAADGKLYVRSMSEFEARVVTGAEPAINPVFSPDGEWLLFWSDSLIKRIAVGGGTAVTICPTSIAPSGITWSDGGILFAQSGTGIMRVAPNGGKPEVLVSVTIAEGLVNGPQLLPGGDALLFTIFPAARRSTASWDRAQIVVQSLRTGERKLLIDGGSDARFVPTGHIVYAVGGTLMAARFDVATLAVTPGSVPIIEGVRRVGAVTGGAAHYAFSNSGSLLYVPGPASVEQQDVLLFDRKGVTEALKLPPGSYAYPRASPDGKRLALETHDGRESNVSIYDLSSASSVRRLTFGGNNRFPIWSGDGQRVAFQSDRDGDLSVFWQPADGGTAERLTKPDPGTSHVPESWAPGGETFLYGVTKGSEVTLWTFSLRDRKATPFGDVRSLTFPTDAAFSPDGKWVVYQVGETSVGEATTYVQPFPSTGSKFQIARGGRPVWSRDGSELFYVPAPTQFMAVAVKTQPNFTFSNPVAVPRGFGIADPAGPRTFDVLPDGRIVGIGFAGQTQSGSTGPAQIHVVLNWFEELKARVPAK